MSPMNTKEKTNTEKRISFVNTLVFALYYARQHFVVVALFTV